MNNKRVLDELLKLVVNNRAYGEEEEDQNEIKPVGHLQIVPLQDRDINYLAIMLLHKSISMKNLCFISRRAIDGCTVYSYIRRELDYFQHYEQLNQNFHNDWVVKLVEVAPMLSFLKLTFRQVLFFLLNKQESHTYELNLVLLVKFVNELKSSYSTLCLEDKQTLKAAISKQIIPNIQPVDENASILINWALIESVKHIVGERLNSTDFRPGLFLEMLQKECSSVPVPFGDKISKLALATFLHNLDKHLSDRMLESGTSKYLYPCNQDNDRFYNDHCSKIRSWLLNNRQNFAKLSMHLDNPAECWRNLNIRMFFDLSTKFQYKSIESPNYTPSFRQTLLSVNTKNWYSNLRMLSLCAKQLNDSSLLYGLDILTNISEVICHYPPLTCMLYNINGQYQKTYDLLKKTEEFKDQQTLVEFLEAVIELGVLAEHEDCIQQLESKKLKELYLTLLSAKKEQLEMNKVEEVKSWLNNWTNLEEISSNTNNNTLHISPMKDYMDLIVPTCLSVISRVPEEEEQQRLELIQTSEWFIGQDFISQSLFSPNYMNSNIKVYRLLLDLLKNSQNPTIPEELVKVHSSDLKWNHLLYRNLCDLKLIEKLKGKQNVHQLDLIKLRAAKFNHRCNNYPLAKSLAKQLEKQAESIETRVLTSMLLLKDDTPTGDKVTFIFNTAKELKSNEGSLTTTRQDLIFKLVRKGLKLDKPAYENIKKTLIPLLVDQEDVFMGEDEDLLLFLRGILKSASFATETKTMLLLSRLSNHQLQEKNVHEEKLLNTTLCLDMNLLELLCKSKVEKHKSYSLECSVRILKHITSGKQLLNEENYNKFKSEHFFERTMSAWIRMKNNLLSLILHQNDLLDNWRRALIDLVKVMVRKNPTLLLYNIIVNRLDLQDELVFLSDKTSNNQSSFLFSSDTSSSVTSFTDTINDHEAKIKKYNDCQRRSSLWNELYDFIKTNNNENQNRWHDVVADTERFLKEIRKISYLCGEYFRNLAMKIPKRLDNFLDYFSKVCDPKSGTLSKYRVEECEKRLKATCEQAIERIRILITYDKRVGKDNLTKYDKSFFEMFIKHLHELEYRLNLLSRKRPLILSDIEKLVKSITELCAVCRSTILQYNSNNRQKLYMELISPMLSRLEPSVIPMPDCCDNSLVDIRDDKSLVTVHKISQTVNLIISKTSPKKLKITGSDGITRSFLLKAHEDLRLDQLIMDIFGLINVQLSAKKGTEKNYRLRRYSVTPVSSRSGLIQWIEAPSLCSTYRAWLHAPNGKKVLEELYQKTCSSLCTGDNDSPKSPADHKLCEIPRSIQSADVFYQLLWSKTKPTKHPLTKSKPFHGNILRYRASFDSSIFEQVVEELNNRMPGELVANQLWHKSCNAHSYYLKTQEFIRSCATISMVGYIIGLGDRHPENILLDSNSGEVIHIDYNICFEMGKTLSIPELVPFRLTQNLIHAFGFAGLEGGFTLSCREVLNSMKSCKTTLLHLLDPINLKFMIGDPAPKTGMEKTQALAALPKILSSSQQRLPGSSMNQSKSSNALLSRFNIEMDMCSQESFDLNNSETGTVALAESSTNAGNMGYLTINNHSAPSKPQEQLQFKLEDSLLNNRFIPQTSVNSRSFDLQHNIKTPAKISPKTAENIFERIKDKLSGTDEHLRVCSYDETSPKDILEKKPLSNHDNTLSEIVTPQQDNRMNNSKDLILLNEAQTTEYQVNALIVEAISLKNKAAMFEGWIPWI